MKRARTSGGSVTGGTGDIKPQYFTLNTGLAAAVDDYVINQVALPVPRFGTMKTKATIMEILTLDWYLAIEDTADVARTNWGFLTTQTSRTDGQTSTFATAVGDVSDPLVFGMVFHTLASTAAGVINYEWPIHVDMTDQNGNGFLVATDRLFIVGANIAGTAGGSYICKMKYRLVNVGITEYVGIVQGQQG